MTLDDADAAAPIDVCFQEIDDGTVPVLRCLISDPCPDVVGEGERLDCYVTDDRDSTNDILVTFWLHPDLSALEDAFLQRRTSLGVSDDAGDCFDVRAPCQGEYDVGDELTGSVAQYNNGDATWLIWTHRPALVYAEAFNDDARAGVVWFFWKDYGPFVRVP